MFKIHTLAVLVAAAALALPAAAFEEAGISLKELSDGSIIEFESSFCDVAVGDTVTVMLMGTAGDAASAEIVAVSVKTNNSATPNKGNKKGGDRIAYVVPVIGMDGRVVDITLDVAEDGWRTVHLHVELSNGDRLGVNLHATPCESNDLTL